MGEIADMMMNGLLCQVCGTLMDDLQEPGYPRTCEDCKAEEEADKRRNRKRRKKRK